MAEDPECEDRIEWLNCMNDSRLNVVKLLVEYPDFIRKISISQSEPTSETEADEQDSDIPTTFKRIH